LQRAQSDGRRRGRIRDRGRDTHQCGNASGDCDGRVEERADLGHRLTVPVDHQVLGAEDDVTAVTVTHGICMPSGEMTLENENVAVLLPDCSTYV
jgi:hypothetical protein